MDSDPILDTLDPLPAETHPFRPSISRNVAVLCVECDEIYAKESQGVKAEELCPRCGSKVGFAINRVIR